MFESQQKGKLYLANFSFYLFILFYMSSMIHLKYLKSRIQPLFVKGLYDILTLMESFILSLYCVIIFLLHLTAEWTNILNDQPYKALTLAFRGHKIFNLRRQLYGLFEYAVSLYSVLVYNQCPYIYIYIHPERGFLNIKSN